MSTKPSSPVLAPALFIGSGVTQYTGAAFAVVLFATMAPVHVAWWRVALAAVILLAWRQPWRRGLTKREIGTSALFGIVMAGMNMAFYEALARIDLGIAVSLEFLGPVAVAVIGGRTWLSRLAGFIALAGVILISVKGVDMTNPQIGWGVFWALIAGGLWAGYIVLGRNIASQRSGLTSLSIGTAAGALFYLPVAGVGVLATFGSWKMFLTVFAVAVLSTVIPYSLEQLAMVMIDAPTFALLTALLPATSLLIGAVILQQFPAPAAVAGLVCVSIAVWLASRSSNPDTKPAG